jgi:hypothetical protein
MKLVFTTRKMPAWEDYLLGNTTREYASWQPLKRNKDHKGGKKPAKFNNS